jgi:predicted protein tyrosine phosphatase
MPEFLPLAHQTEFEDVLCLKFDDILEKTYNSLPADEQARMTLFNEQHAKQVVEFFHQWKDKVDLFVVHCDAGISRSSAIAISLAEYGNYAEELERMTGLSPNGTDSHDYWPNPLVWSTIRHITGWDTARQHEFEELFQFVEEVHSHLL